MKAVSGSKESRRGPHRVTLCGVNRHGIAVRLHDQHVALEVVRGLAGPERENLFACWIEPRRGADTSRRRFMEVEVQDQGDALLWVIHPA